jgi:putative phage-type endonuclease
VTIQTIDPTDKQHWLAERAQDITSTEVSALFGLSPYMTEFELWHRKKDSVIVEIADNERMRWGRRLESAIAEGAAEDNNWRIEKFSSYLRVPELRIGSSFDFKMHSERGVGILEVKNVDSLVFRNNWSVSEDGVLEAPDHIELQVQHQMFVSGLPYVVVVALIGGNTQHILTREADSEVAQTIANRVAEFWESVAANEMPSPDYTRDASYIIKTLRGNADPNKVVVADGELDDLIKQYHHVAREIDGLQDVKDGYKAQILTMIGDAAKVKSAHGSISCGMTKDSPGTIITPDMVGTAINARKGYRQFRFTPAK